MSESPDVRNIERARAAKTAKRRPEHDSQITGRVLESTSEGFVVWDSKQKLVAWSNKCPDFWYEPENILRPGMPMVELLRHIATKDGFGPGDPDKLARRELRRIRKAGKDSEDEFEMRDGRVIHVQRNSMPDGGHASTYMDITERRRAEAALQESEERLRHIMDNSPFGVSIVSLANRKRLYVNHRFVELLGGGSDEEILNWPAAESYSDPSKREQNWAAFKRDDVLTSIEEHRKRLDGTTWWCLTDWRPIVFQGEKAVMNWHYDITGRKRMEEALVESEEKHRHFSADVAHELRTPLAVLRSQLDNLENSETIRSLIKDVDAMSRLVSQLLATTRLDSLTVNPDDKADLHVIGTAVAKYLAPLAIKEGRSIEMTGTQHPVIVRGNDNALEMAVRNLVENAIRYSARKTVVTIHISDEPAISVIDRGRSIPPEQQEMIFQRFKRSDRRAGGAGLGLSIVQRVVKAHQATIDVSDASGGGTVFKISFPSPKSLKVVEV